jgi:hypothetical protein
MSKLISLLMLPWICLYAVYLCLRGDAFHSE